MNRRVHTFLVDIGEVLVALNVSAAISQIETFSRLSADQIRERLTHYDPIVEYERGQIGTVEFYRRLSEVIELDAPLEVFKKAWLRVFDFQKTASGHYLTDGFFQRLKRVYRVVALSNTNELHFEFLSESLPLVRQYDDYVLSHLVGSVKPEEAIFRAAIAKTGGDPERLFFVDDLAENIEAAKKFGIKGVVFEGEKRLLEHLSRGGLI